MSEVIVDALTRVPNYQSFMTLDELNSSTLQLVEKHPDLAEAFKVGKSSEGRVIYALKIGHGKRKALLIGCPHPNELVGTLTIEFLCRELVENDELREVLDYTWYIVKVADPDGLKLNEGWLKGPFTLLNYIKGYYRPPESRQVEWTFPIRYKSLRFGKPLPETRALMRLIRSIKPDFIYSLHNSSFGGVYYYVTEEVCPLYVRYYDIPRSLGVPLALGEPEGPWVERLAPAIYRMVSASEYYDYLEKYCGTNPAEVIKSGADSYDYAKRFNPRVFEFVAEVPYFYHPAAESEKPARVLRRKAVLDKVSASRDCYLTIRRWYDSVRGYLKLKTRFREAVEYYLETAPADLTAEENWARMALELDRQVTEAEFVSSYYTSRLYDVLNMSHFYRMLRAEVEAGAGEPLKSAMEEVEEELEAKVERLERETTWLAAPLRALVQIQLATGLYTSLHIGERLTRRRA